MLNVDAIISKYASTYSDVGATDEDLLYLRGYLERALGERPEAEEVASRLEILISESRPLQWALEEANESDNESLLKAVAEIQSFRRALKSTIHLYAHFLRTTAEIEKRYMRFIKLAKVRSDIAFNNAPAEHLAVFIDFLQQCLHVLEPRLPNEVFGVLKTRLRREFEQIPERALDLANPVPEAFGNVEATAFYATEDGLDEIVQRLRAQNVNLDDSDSDLLHLRALLQSLRQMASLVAETFTSLREVLVALEVFVEDDDILGTLAEQDHAKAQRLQGELERFIQILSEFEQGLEKRHETIILLTLTRQSKQLKERAAEKIALYDLLLARLRTLLLDAISVEDYRYMERRLQERMMP
jgi:hypothetical protein